MRLQTKIQKNMILIILVTLAIAYAVTHTAGLPVRP